VKVNSVVVLEIVADDMNNGKEFYDLQESGVGDYFWDSLIADIESLVLYAGFIQNNSVFTICSQRGSRSLW